MSFPKICIFTETYYPVMGGGETQARLLAENLAALGYAVSILTRRTDSSLPKTEEFGAITVHRLSPTGVGQYKKWGLILSSFPKLIRLRSQFDIIFVSGFRIIGLSAVLATKLLGKVSVLKADSQGETSGRFFDAGLKKVGFDSTWFPFRLFLKARNFILKHANAHTAITEDIVSELTTSGINESSIYRIPNCVDIQQFKPVNENKKLDIRRKLGFPVENKTVVFTGRLVSYKGLPLLLEVWREIQKKHDNVTLLLVGTGGLDIHNCEDDLRQFVEKNQLEGSVLFTGSVANVPEYLQASDIYVLPSEDDAFPSSLIEAMACGLPAVVTPVGAIKTIVEDGKNGLVIQPGDFEQLYAALERLITDPVLGEKMGEAGRHTVQGRYSAETVTQSYIALFNSLINPTGLNSTEMAEPS